MGNPKRRQNSVYFILEWKNEQRITGTFIRQFREHINLSIQFPRVLWSSTETTKVEYGFI